LFNIIAKNYIKMDLKWYLVSITGLMFIGSGLCIFGEAIIQKINNNSYFWWGTLSLVVFNTGICLVGHAIYLKKINHKNL